MSNRFEGQVVVVTGAAGGLGEALAEAYLVEGASVALADVDAKRLDETVNRLHESAPNRVIPVQTDVTNERSVQRMVQATLDMYKRLDVLVSNAEIMSSGAVTDFDAAAWRRVIEVNLVGYFLCAKQAARVMKERSGGSIVQINSRHGFAGIRENSAYAASKSGGVGLTRSLALDLASDNIRVNAVCPGIMVDSAAWAEGLCTQYAAQWGVSEAEARDRCISHVPLGRGCSYGDVVSAVLFLSSSQAAYVTGQMLHVDGGPAIQ